MRKMILALSMVLAVAACDGKGDGESSSANGITVSDAYSFAVAQGMPAAAVFMTIDNDTDTLDHMIGFKTDVSKTTMLHTMVINGDIVRMHRAQGYAIPAKGEHVLQPNADHVMLVGLKQPWVAGGSFKGIAVFENAGEVPVSVTIRPRETK